MEEIQAQLELAGRWLDRAATEDVTSGKEIGQIIIALGHLVESVKLIAARLPTDEQEAYIAHHLR